MRCWLAAMPLSTARASRCGADGTATHSPDLQGNLRKSPSLQTPPCAPQYCSLPALPMLPQTKPGGCSKFPRRPPGPARGDQDLLFKSTPALPRHGTASLTCQIPPNQGYSPQAANFASKTYQTRALRCIPAGAASPSSPDVCPRSGGCWRSAAQPLPLLMSVSGSS